MDLEERTLEEPFARCCEVCGELIKQERKGNHELVRLKHRRFCSAECRRAARVARGPDGDFPKATRWPG